MDSNLSKKRSHDIPFCTQTILWEVICCINTGKPFCRQVFFGSILMHIHFIKNLATHFIGIQVCFFGAPVMHGQFIETFAWTSYKSTLVSTFRSNWILPGISSMTWFEPTRPPKNVLGQREHDIPIESTWLWPHNWFYRSKHDQFLKQSMKDIDKWKIRWNSL